MASNIVEIAIKGVDQASKIFSDVEKSANRSFNQIEDSVNDVDNAINNVDALEIDTSATESAVIDAETSVNEFTGSIEEAGTTSETVGDRIKNSFNEVAEYWKEITVATGIAGAAMEGFARKQGDTNATLGRLSIVTGESEEALRKSADAMTNHTFATEDAVTGMEMLIQRGIDTQGQFEDILPHVDNLSDATGKDFPEALESADRILKPFGQDLNDLGENTDQMSRIMAQTDIPLGTLERNLGRIPDQLQDMGFGLDEASAGIEVFRDRGFSGQESVREFRRAVEESDGSMDDFLDILGLTTDEWEEYQKAVEPADELTQQLADNNNDSMTVMEKLSANVGNLMTKYGGLAEGIGVLAPLMMGLGPIIKGVQTATALFNTTLLASPITWIILGITALIATIVLLWNNWDEVSQWLAESWEWIKDTSIEIFESIAEFFSAIWERIKEIFETVVSAISDFISETWETIKNITSGVWESIKESIDAVINAIKDVIETVWNAISDVTTGVWEGITGFLSGIFDSITGSVGKAFDWISDKISGIWEGIRDVTSDIWESMVGIIKAPINAIIGLINGMIGALNKVNISVPEVPDWVPGIGGMGGGTIGFNIPHIPYLAAGGMVTSSTLAMIGEGSDDEAVIPLNNQVMAKLGSSISSHMERPDETSIDYRALANAIKETLGDMFERLVESLGVKVIVENMNVQDPEDIQKIARELEKMIRRTSRKAGTV